MQYDCLCKRLRRQCLSFGLQDNSLVRIIDESRATHARGIACRRQHFTYRQFGLDQAFRHDLNLQLLGFAAKYGDFRHAGHGQQTLLDRPVGECA